MEETKISEKGHSNADIAVGYVEFGEVDGDEINEIYHIAVENPVGQITNSAADNEKQGSFQREVMFCFFFRYLQIFQDKEKHSDGGYRDEEALLSHKRTEGGPRIF